MSITCSLHKGSNKHIQNLIRKSERRELDVIVSGQNPVTCKYDTLCCQFLLIFKQFKQGYILALSSTYSTVNDLHAMTSINTNVQAPAVQLNINERSDPISSTSS